MADMKIEEAIGHGVALLFIALAFFGYFAADFSLAKAMLMMLVGLPLAGLAPAILRDPDQDAKR